MVNPIQQAMQRTPQAPIANNQVMQTINAIMNSGNPQQAVMNMLQSNPQLSSMINQAANTGQSYKDLFYAAAAAKGVDPNVIINQLNQLKF